MIRAPFRARRAAPAAARCLAAPAAPAAAAHLAVPAALAAVRHARLVALLVAACFAAPALAARGPVPQVVKSVTELSSGASQGKGVTPLNPTVVQSNQWFLNWHGFQELDGTCNTRGWTGVDLTGRIFSRVQGALTVNRSIYTGTAEPQPPVLPAPRSTTGLISPRGLAVTDSGKIAFTDIGYGREVYMAYPDADVIRVFGNPPAGDMGTYQPGYLAFDPASSGILAVDFGLVLSPSRIYRYPSAGGVPAFVAGSTTGTVLDTTADVANLGTVHQIAADDAGNIYFASIDQRKVRMVRTDGRVVTVAGTGADGDTGDGGPATAAEFRLPIGVAVDGGGTTLYIADQLASRVRRVNLQTGIITAEAATTVGSPPLQGNLALSGPTLYVNAGQGIARPVAGSLEAVAGYAGFFGPATGTSQGTQQVFQATDGLAADGAGGVYFAETDYHLILRLRSDGVVETVAGLSRAVQMESRALRVWADASTDPDLVKDWVRPSGYGNNWSQRVVSPPVALAGLSQPRLTFDAFLDLRVPGPIEGDGIGVASGTQFATVQALGATGGWVSLSSRIQVRAGGASAFTERAIGRGIYQFDCRLREDGNEAIALAEPTRLRIVVQTHPLGSDEDSLQADIESAVGPTTGFGAAVLDNLALRDGATDVLAPVDFEDGTTGPWTLEALNGVAPLALPFTRDVPLPATNVALRTGFDFADPSCAWTFTSAGDSLPDGVLARITSPWIARANPSDATVRIEFDGKLNTITQGRFVSAIVRNKLAGAERPYSVAPSFFLLNSFTTGGDLAAPFVGAIMTYPDDFQTVFPLSGDSIQIVFQVEDRGDGTGTFPSRPVTRLPFIDNVRTYQLALDADFDGVKDDQDACPTACAAGQDADGDGCVDPAANLRTVEAWSNADRPIRFRLSQDGDPDIADGSDLTAVRNGFATWQGVSGASVPLAEEPVTAQELASAMDGINLVTFQDDEPLPPDVLAITPTLSMNRRLPYGDRLVPPGQIVDADLIFNPAASFTTTGALGAFDLQSVALHEAGHFIGLSHSGATDASMFFVLQLGTQGASLTEDDMAAAAAAYPAADLTTNFGTIRGRVVRGGTLAPVPGALVTAERLDARLDPIAVVSSDYSDENGSYALRRVPAGTYGVRITPLDGLASALMPPFVNERVALTAQTNFQGEWFSVPESNADDPAAKEALTVAAATALDSINVVTNTDVTPPAVTSVSPADDSTDVRIDTPLLVNFSEPIEAASLAGDFFLTAGPDTILGKAVLTNFARTLIFTPGSPLDFGTEYELRLTTGITDREGVALAADFVSRFNTQTQPAVAIFDVQPRTVTPGSLITILGAGFDGVQAEANNVRYLCPACGPADIFPALGAASPTSMVSRVPAVVGSVAGTFTVQAVVGGDVSNSFTLTVLPPGQVQSPAPAGSAINLGFAVRDVAVAPDGSVAFAVGGTGFASISLVSTDPDFRMPQIALLNGGEQMALTPDGRRAYVTRPLFGDVVAVDADPGSGTFRAALDTVVTGGTPDGIAVANSGRRAYVTDQGLGVVYELDIDPGSVGRNTVLQTIDVVGALLTGGVSVGPLGEDVYLTSADAGAARRRLLLGTDEVFLSSATDGGAAVTPGESEAVFTDPAGGRLLTGIIGFAGRDSIPLGGTPVDVVVTRDGRAALVANQSLNLLQVVDLQTSSPNYHLNVAQVGTGSGPIAVAASKDSNVVVVGNNADRSISVYALGQGALIVNILGVSPPVAFPGRQVAVHAQRLGGAVSVDVGGALLTPTHVAQPPILADGLGFAVPAMPQGSTSVTVEEDTSGTVVRSLSLPFTVVSPVEAFAPAFTGFGIPVGPGPCGGDFLTAAASSPDGGLLAVGWLSSTFFCDEPRVSFYRVSANGAEQMGVQLAQSIIGPGPGLFAAELEFTASGAELWARQFGQYTVLDANPASAGFGSTLSILTGGFPDNATSMVPDPLNRGMIIGISAPGFSGPVGWVSRETYNGVGTSTSFLGPGGVGSVAVTPDGRYLVAGVSARARVVDLDTFTQVDSTPPHAGAGAPKVAVSPDGRRAVGLFGSGAVAVWSLDPALAPVGTELFFGIPAGFTGLTLGNVISGPDRGGLLGLAPATGEIVKLDLEADPVSAAFTTRFNLGDDPGLIAGSPDGRRVWVGPVGVATPFEMALLDLSPATQLSLISGGDQEALPGQELPLPVRVKVTDPLGNPEPGVVVEFALDPGEGVLDAGVLDAALARRITDVKGEALVRWQMPASPGMPRLEVTALGTGQSLGVDAEAEADNSTITPVVVELGPADGATGINAGSALFVRFNQPMVQQSVASSVALFANGQPVLKSVTLLQGDEFALVTPGQPLPFAAACSLAVAAGALDQDGQATANPAFTRFTVEPEPALALASIFPPAASEGATVTLIGNGFSAVTAQNTVSFAGSSAGVVTASQTQLVVVVPQGAVSGNVTVQVGSGTSNAIPFNVLPPNPDPGGVIGELTAGGGIRDIAITPDGTRAYITNPGTNSVTALSIQAASTLGNIPVGLLPQAIAILASGARAYVCNTGSDNVSVIDTDPASAQYNTVIQTIPVGDGPVAVASFGTLVYVVNTNAGTLEVVDANPGNATYHQVVATRPTGDNSDGVDLSADGTRAYVGTAGGITVVNVTNLSNLAVEDTIQIPSGVVDIAVRPNGTVLLALAGDGNLYVINIVPSSTSYNNVVATRPTGDNSDGVDISADGTLAFVTNSSGNVVFVFQIVDGASGAVLKPGSSAPGPAVSLTLRQTFPVGESPFGVATDPLGRFTLVVNRGSGDLTILGFSTSLPPVAVEFDFDPNTLNLKSNGRWVQGYIEPEPPRLPSDIVVSSVRLNGMVPVDLSGPVTIGDHDGDGRPDLGVKFDRGAVQMVVPTGDAVQVCVTGEITPRNFSGCDVIRVKRGNMLAPLAGSAVPPGQLYTLRWETPTGVSVQSVRVFHSMNHGWNWTEDATGLPNTGQYAWTAPDTVTDSALVAIVLVEQEGQGDDVTGVLAMSGYFHLNQPTAVEPAPAVVTLAPVRPNPAEGVAFVRFGLPQRAAVELELYDVQGRRVAALVDGERPAGWHVVEWRGVTDAGRARAGLYWVRFRAAGVELRRRVVWLR